ncbi:unnamed protein product [Microthlaspi erraticum]|uniref:Uncharacterized protein n=1 Tax=Microthlaspi erraticum TaxID=1685480 RepID=A0A6D2K796_9BRAS|nr:unnamed protein product [Microthlaspi erraticum]
MVDESGLVLIPSGDGSSSAANLFKVFYVIKRMFGWKAIELVLSNQCYDLDLIVIPCRKWWMDRVLSVKKASAESVSDCLNQLEVAHQRPSRRLWIKGGGGSLPSSLALATSAA